MDPLLVGVCFININKVKGGSVEFWRLGGLGMEDEHTSANVAFILNEGFWDLPCATLYLFPDHEVWESQISAFLSSSHDPCDLSCNLMFFVALSVSG